jgi:hypothetical protein
MPANLLAAIAQIKRGVAEVLSAAAMEGVAREVQHRWRQRELGPAQTVWAFLLQILHGNVACTQVARFAQLSCSATAYCTARTRLPLALVERLVERTCQQARGPTRSALWHGHRTFFVDGSSCSMPDTPEL